MHTANELTSFLEGSTDPRAAEFLTLRQAKEKDQKKALQKQLDEGHWRPLFATLVREATCAGQLIDTPQFKYPGMAGSLLFVLALPSVVATGQGAELLRYLTTPEFLHFATPASAI